MAAVCSPMCSLKSVATFLELWNFVPLQFYNSLMEHSITEFDTSLQHIFCTV